MADMPQGAPAPAAAPAGGPPQAGGQGDQIAELVSNISDGLAMLADALQDVDPQSAQALMSMGDQYKQIMGKVMGGSGAAGGPGMASPEQGAQGGAKPAGPTY